MIKIIEWFQTNWEQLVQIITGLISVATIIVRLTPTLKDDNFLLKVVKFLSKYIALNDSRDHNKLR